MPPFETLAPEDVAREEWVRSTQSRVDRLVRKIVPVLLLILVITLSVLVTFYMTHRLPPPPAPAFTQP